MGAAETIGGLEIEVENTNIVSGEALTGKVHLLAKQSISAEGLSLRLKGKEVISWAEIGADSTPFAHTRKHTLLSLGFPLTSFPSGSVLPGQYSYPFSIRTPTTLTASLSVVSGENKAEVRYSLVAEMLGQRNVLKTKKKLTVTRDINPLEGIGEVEEKRFRVKSCCCINRGEVGLAAFLDKDAYFPGDMVGIDVKVNNRDCGLPVVSLKATIIREIVLQDPASGSVRFSEVLNSCFLKTEIPGGKSLLSTQSVQLSLSIIEMTGKPFTAPSVAGKLLRCRYRLELEAKVGGWGTGCGVVPRISQEVNIFQRTARMSEGRAPPSFWNPAVMPIAKFE